MTSTSLFFCYAPRFLRVAASYYKEELGITSTECTAPWYVISVQDLFYAMSVAHQFASSNMYKNILIVGAEVPPWFSTIQPVGPDIYRYLWWWRRSGYRSTHWQGRWWYPCYMYASGTLCRRVLYQSGMPWWKIRQHRTIWIPWWPKNTAALQVFKRCWTMDSSFLDEWIGSLNVPLKDADAIMEVLDKSGHQPSDLKMLRFPIKPTSVWHPSYNTDWNLRDDQII